MRLIQTLVMLLLFSSVSMAAGRLSLDPRLGQLLNSATDGDRVVQVILQFESPLTPPSILNRLGRQQTLRRQAEVAQRRTLQVLRTAGASAQWKSYWLINAVAVRGPVRLIRSLLTTEDVAVAHLVGRAHLLLPVAGRVVRAGGSGFTAGLEKLRIPELRQKHPMADGRGVRVGILDTGIEESHPDLRGKVLAFRDFSEESRNGPYDDHGHGTHVAGTIAGGDASGTAIGVAPGARLIVGKLFNAEGSADEIQILDSMQWMADPDGNPATDDAPMIVSNSWTSDVASGNPNELATCRAVQAWVDLSILPVFAAGNYGPKPKTVAAPGGCPAAVAIGAIDSKDGIAKFSSRGPVIWSTGTLMKPLLTAPGVAVLSSFLQGRYVEMSGTSMATPHVAGVVALLLQAHPGARPEDVARWMVQGTVDLGRPGQDPDFGFGRLDAIQALESSLFRRH